MKNGETPGLPVYPSDRNRFNFGCFPQDIVITGPIPPLKTILDEWAALRTAPSQALIVCDQHTLPLARSIANPDETPFCVLEPGESRKDWGGVEQILRSAHDAGLGRDSLLIACGGGVVSDLSGFAASVYMRGIRLCIVSTSLLGMVDAAVGGKTGCDIFGIKNLAGSFYPARLVYLPVDSLATLPPAEWKSGMAELIKTAVLDGEDLFRLLQTGPEPAGAAPRPGAAPRSGAAPRPGEYPSGQTALRKAIARAVAYKGRIVEEDPRETGGRRILLNLGHSFGHALESSSGLGRISHGEAVAWGIARACELGQSLGITPPQRARRILTLLKTYGYETAAPHPLMGDPGRFMEALARDKKNRRGKAVFVVPAATGAETLTEAPGQELILKICGIAPLHQFRNTVT
ncbi:MAG: 3-dehydroquinate synthase [Treponema sp.]|jgi:3-dehydroquinate synthase|nr:3-dehydroquinate synthase [Treponema sp.]